MPQEPALAVIGGSGLYNMPDLKETETLDFDTPFGKPSAPIIVGTLAGKRVAFLARHGVGHHISPTNINYRANIYALKQIGVQRIVSVSACGSLREDFSPGHIVIPDQIFDFTRQRKNTFFDEDLVAHIGAANPFCADMSRMVLNAVTTAGGVAHAGGTLITIEGPRFSTRAESNQYRAWGMSVIGMTASPEVFLAREAEMCYATMAHVTDYDVWHVSEETVSVEMVVRTLNKNTHLAQEAVKQLVMSLPEARGCDCDHLLAEALITNHERVSAHTREKLSLLIGKYLPQ